MGGVVVWLFMKNRRGDSSPASALIEKQAKEKEEHKQKILEFANANDKITNNDIEKLLGVSDKTVQRYFNELEGEGKIKQTGETGRGVFYTKA